MQRRRRDEDKDRGGRSGRRDSRRDRRDVTVNVKVVEIRKAAAAQE